MLYPFVAILALGSTTFAVPAITSAVPGATVCPATTENGRRLVENYVTRARYEEVRNENGVPRTTPDQVRALDARDAGACTSIIAALEQQAAATGIEFRLGRLEFYQAGEHYYAVRPVAPSSCVPGPNHACIDLRWQALHIFDRDLSLLRSIAI